MRVAVFTRYPKNADKPRGGVESVAVVLVEALAALDDLDVHVLTLERGLSSSIMEHHGLFTVHRLSASRWPQIIDILVGPGRRRLVRSIRELQVDILHTHETFGLGLGDLDIPHVFTVHGFDHANVIAEKARFAKIRSFLWRRVERWGLGRQKHIISISPYVCATIKPQTRAQIYNIDNPVDQRFFQIQRQPEPGRILCVGWISERKNTLGSIKALAAVIARGINAKLVIAGQPRDQAYYQQVLNCIEQLGLRDRVELPGQISHDALPNELARAQVFLLPSRQENSPMAIGEAMAVGVPVVTANRCGMPYMVSEGVSGYLIDPENTEEIADRLALLLTDSERTQAFGRAARIIAEERFHPAMVARRTRDVYYGLCRKDPHNHSSDSG